MCWNACSIHHPAKINFIRSRNEDIILINETWRIAEGTIFPGYKLFFKNRKEGKIGGGVAILTKDNLNVREVSALIKDTILIKILLNRSKCLYVITSYFPTCNTGKKWESR